MACLPAPWTFPCWAASNKSWKIICKNELNSKSFPAASAYLQTKHSGWNFLNIAVMQRPEIGLRHIAHIELLGARQRPILDKCISALGQTWHPECFCCSGCGKLVEISPVRVPPVDVSTFQFGDEGFHERGDAAYCRGCYFGQFAPRCARCNEPITENFISSLNKQVSMLLLWSRLKQFPTWP